VEVFAEKEPLPLNQPQPLLIHAKAVVQSAAPPQVR
jgi:hypothetical protein